jgi:hypothetical protein
VYFDVKGRTRRGKESARKIFERGARSGQRNARLYRVSREKQPKLNVKIM